MSFVTAQECRVRWFLMRRALLFVASTAILTIAIATGASAQCGKQLCPGVGNSNIAAANATFDLNSQFLQSLIRNSGSRSAMWSDTQAASTTVSLVDRPSPLAYGSDSQSTSQGGSPDNPLAAYAAATQPDPRYRAWLEGYGSRSHTSAQRTFTGDARTDFGGIAGIGAMLTPDISVGASVDQGRSNIAVVGGTQSSYIDLTQIGLNAAFSSGPWGLGIAGVYGFGNIHSSRIETAGEATASYGTRIWAAVAELSYYWSSGSWRVVPKAGADWTQTSVDSYTESGGTTPVAGSVQATERARIYGAIELGYTKVLDRTTYDASIYGKLIDIVSQRVDSLLTTPLTGPPTLVVPGVYDARTEFATGASFSVRLASGVRLYALYDGRFRSDFSSNGGTIGVEVRW